MEKMYKTFRVIILFALFVILHGADKRLHEEYKNANCKYYLYQHPEVKSGPCWDAVEHERERQAGSKEPNAQ